MAIGRPSNVQSSSGGKCLLMSSIIRPIIIPPTQKIDSSVSVSNIGINGHHALPIFFAKIRFTIAPMTNNVGRIHQSPSFCIKLMVIAAGASSHVMAYCAIRYRNANPSTTQQKTPNPVPAATGTSSIRMYILYFLPSPPNKFAPGAKRTALRPEHCLWYAEFYCRSR